MSSEIKLEGRTVNVGDTIYFKDDHTECEVIGLGENLITVKSPLYGCTSERICDMTWNMTIPYIVSGSATFAMPPAPKFKVEIAHVTYFVPAGKEPNWFHRKMQEFCFGVKWSKL